MKPILEVRDLSKKFRINKIQDSYLSLREHVQNIFKPAGKEEDFWALKNVSFEVYPGESMGIIGKNGAGKSTLLKLLSKITPPTSGKIINRGRVASLLEVGTGFHPELTGRENIYLNGSILGLKRKEITKHFEAIVNFSGIEKFIETPLKRFSSGMQLRLAFAVAAHLEPEILIIDEVLAVGDAEFQKKCLGKMDEVSKSGRTVLFVSHDMNVVSSLCTRSILLSQGEIKFNGSSSEGISLYLKNELSQSHYLIDRKPSKSIYIKEVKVLDNNLTPKSTFFHNENVNISIGIGIENFIEKTSFFMTVLDEMKRPVCSFEVETLKDFLHLRIDSHFLTKGKYSLHMFINQPRITRWNELYDICSFEIIDNGSDFQKHGDYKYGSVFGYGKWIH